MPGTGRCALWARLPNTLDMSAAALAILGDYVPTGVGQALGELKGGTSLDNTLRVVRLVETEWVLLDIRLHAIDHGVGHGLAHLWAQDGTLLATASQSCTVKALTSVLAPYHPNDKVDVSWVDSSGTHHTASVTLSSAPPA